MIKKGFILSLLLLPFAAFAAQSDSGFSGAFQSLIDFGTDIMNFFTIAVPNFLHRLTAWLFEAVIYIKFLLYVEAVKFSWQVAKLVIADLSISETIMASLSALPPTIKAVISDLRLIDAINVILNAHVTRWVMRFI
ncbi:DUF2523 domain-containing protein [Shewanella chilikensis]|uniref:DUF2523 family protein n=1 Tax=Shewanella chilikensis TaxID=558541 RepID=UPI00200D70B2|nr:DUF2523 family protein [Shewanella chilikensis]MCL1164415.1 DUF2523 domain-containing protein [Shewanella chilikensis]